MKAGDRLYCIKDYVDPNIKKINVAGKEYTVVSVTSFHGNISDIVISITTENQTQNVFWIKYQKFEDTWDDMRQTNLVYDFFMTVKELRKQKLDKLNSL